MLKQLDKEFEGTGDMKGFHFRQVASNDKGYVYSVESDGVTNYEVFKKETVKLCLDFANRVYSETDRKEKYPKSDSFGINAWCTNSLKKATDILEKL